MSESALDPTPRMKALYHWFARQWGESGRLIWFDPARASGPVRVEKLHVAVWPANDDCDVTTFVTLGVSEVELAGCEIRRVEFHWAVRRHLSHDEIQLGAKYLANLSQYPFDHGRCFDWWNTLASPGQIPFFPTATALLLRPPFTSETDQEVSVGGEQIRMLYLAPLNSEQHQILMTEGVDAYLDYLERTGLDQLGAP